MFIINWLFDKLGYMPKITVDTKFEAWPFPAEEKNDSSKKKPTVKKATTRKPKAAVAAKTARTKKAK